LITVDSNNNITISRGDTATLTITAMDTSVSPPVPFEFNAEDDIIFTVKKDPKNATALIEKTVHSDSTGVITIELTTSDTSERAFGTYSYDIRCKFTNDKVYTPQTPRNFIIAEVDGNV
jgi:hypothetical protein